MAAGLTQSAKNARARRFSQTAAYRLTARGYAVTERKGGTVKGYDTNGDAFSLSLTFASFSNGETVGLTTVTRGPHQAYAHLINRAENPSLAQLLDDARKPLRNTYEKQMDFYRAAWHLLEKWTGENPAELDAGRRYDLAELLKMARAGYLAQNDKWTPAAFTPRTWPSGNRGTAIRLAALYTYATGQDKDSPGTLQNWLADFFNSHKKTPAGWNRV